MYEHKFNVGHYPVVASVSSGAIDDLLTRGESQSKKDIGRAVESYFFKSTSELALSHPAGLASILMHADSEHPLHYLFAHGFSTPKEWWFHDNNKNKILVQDFLENPAAAAWIVMVCNPSGYRLPSKGKPTLYPLGDFSLVNFYAKAVNFTARLPDSGTTNPEMQLKVMLSFIDQLFSFRYDPSTKRMLVELGFDIDKELEEIKENARKVLSS